MIVPLEAGILHLVDMVERSLLVFQEAWADTVPHPLVLAIDDPVQAVVALLGARCSVAPLTRRLLRPEIGRTIGEVDVVVGGNQFFRHGTLLGC